MAALRTDWIIVMSSGFLGSNKWQNLPTLEIPVKFVYSTQEKVKNLDNDKLWMEVIIVTFSDAVIHVSNHSIGFPIHVASNNAVKLVETQAVNFAWQILILFCVIINKLNPNCSYWQILSLVCPKKYSINLKVRAKIVGTMNKVY